MYDIILQLVKLNSIYYGKTKMSIKIKPCSKDTSNRNNMYMFQIITYDL